ncbi:hypothetical protein HDG68_001357 [Isoptericola chiayiensis]|nr:hypothetical protein [Isoptericola chiayiensis]
MTLPAHYHGPMERTVGSPRRTSTADHTTTEASR